MTDALMPGADPGACPDCGRWRKAGLLHECEVVTAPEQSATDKSAAPGLRAGAAERPAAELAEKVRISMTWVPPAYSGDALAALDALTALAERAEEERRIASDMFHDAQSESRRAEAAEARAEEAEADNARLREALRFYAVASTYIEGSEPHPLDFATGIVPIEQDGGAIARAALAGTPGQENT